MITDADVKKLEKTFATKEELEKLETRTAEGFTDVQTQLNEIKQDLSGVKTDVSCLKTDVSCLKTNVSCLKTDVSCLKTDVSEIKNTLLTMQDKIYGELRNLHIENQVTATYRPKIENHEQRITKVETVVFAN